MCRVARILLDFDELENSGISDAKGLVKRNLELEVSLRSHLSLISSMRGSTASLYRGKTSESSSLV